jgi:hypothetical protein
MSKKLSLEVGSLAMAATLYGALHVNKVVMQVLPLPSRFERLVPKASGLKEDAIFVGTLTGSAYVIAKGLSMVIQ